MKPRIISHRANLDGPNPNTENTLDSIQKCIELEIDMELDIWYVNNKFYLGHDSPCIEFNPFIFDFKKSNVWFHCKTIETLDKLFTNTFWYRQNYANQYTFFYHNTDAVTLTSALEFWTYPGEKLCHRSIAVMPDYTSHEYQGKVCKLLSTNEIKGICTDYVHEWKEKLIMMENIYE